MMEIQSKEQYDEAVTELWQLLNKGIEPDNARLVELTNAIEAYDDEVFKGEIGW